MSPPARISRRLPIEGAAAIEATGKSEMMKRCGFLLLPPDTLRPDVGAENLGRSCAGRLVDEPIIYQRSAPSKIIGQQTLKT